MLDTVRSGLQAAFDARLVAELLAAYRECKENFLFGGLRLSAVEGGRFCEAAFRMLEQASTGSFTALGASLDTERLIRTLSNLPPTAFSDSIRLHIPRSLRVVYDIRNKRDAAHLADGIDPNIQDASIVAAVLDWVMAEFVRLYHNMPADRAQEIVQALVQRKAPAVQDFDGFVKVLRPELGVSDYTLLILYERGAPGATQAQIEQWVKPSMRANLGRTLRRLVDDKAFLHLGGGRYVLTASGIAEVERRRLHHT